jgi:hypothetical protein
MKENENQRTEELLYLLSELNKTINAECKKFNSLQEEMRFSLAKLQSKIQDRCQLTVELQTII